MKWLPRFRLTVDGQDVTGRFAPRLVDLSLIDAAGVESDRLQVRLSDTELFARLQEPPVGAEMKLWLGYGAAVRYMGMFVADRVEIGGPPDEMTITAVAAPFGPSSGGKSALTEQRSRSWPDGTTLGTLVSTIASEHGLKPAVSESLASIPLPHLDQVDESDIHLLSRISRDLDALVKPGDGQIVVAKRGESLAVGGKPMPVIPLVPSDVSSWRAGRNLERVGQVVATWGDRDAGDAAEVTAGSGEPVRRLRHRYPSQAAAQAAADAEYRRAARAIRSVDLDLPGNPDLVAEGRVMLTEFRSYVDGPWLITRVTHRLNSSGYRCLVAGEPPEGTGGASA
ncbi:contractile injection system protein, VgrG/Pvc8 family [Limimaricola variabilis]|uniref:contractile injection system protein, VgrG/Pvc8 family n=1 Tax=Limimaricola variabilis TaxID=1492771 RepID=UPI002AC8DC40|nr:contractile injection system protein, VgrG/Pvc8 family [Limimaricola variabilis]WPY95587.1 contractile injection system protein, VgrG/Pvc8 family [Limimaricola variabilis]